MAYCLSEVTGMGQQAGWVLKPNVSQPERTLYWEAMAWEIKKIQNKKNTSTFASLQAHFRNFVAKYPLKVKYSISMGNGKSKSITKTTIKFFWCILRLVFSKCHQFVYRITVVNSLLSRWWRNKEWRPEISHFVLRRRTLLFFREKCFYNQGLSLQSWATSN